MKRMYWKLQKSSFEPIGSRPTHIESWRKSKSQAETSDRVAHRGSVSWKEVNHRGEYIVTQIGNTTAGWSKLSQLTFDSWWLHRSWTSNPGCNLWRSIRPLECRAYPIYPIPPAVSVRCQLVAGDKGQYKYFILPFVFVTENEEKPLTFGVVVWRRRRVRRKVIPVD